MYVCHLFFSLLYSSIYFSIYMDWKSKNDSAELSCKHVTKIFWYICRTIFNIYERIRKSCSNREWNHLSWTRIKVCFQYCVWWGQIILSICKAFAYICYCKNLKKNQKFCKRQKKRINGTKVITRYKLNIKCYQLKDNISESIK